MTENDNSKKKNTDDSPHLGGAKKRPDNLSPRLGGERWKELNKYDKKVPFAIRFAYLYIDLLDSFEGQEDLETNFDKRYYPEVLQSVADSMESFSPNPTLQPRPNPRELLKALNDYGQRFFGGLRLSEDVSLIGKDRVELTAEERVRNGQILGISLTGVLSPGNYVSNQVLFVCEYPEDLRIEFLNGDNSPERVIRFTFDRPDPQTEGTFVFYFKNGELTLTRRYLVDKNRRLLKQG